MKIILSTLLLAFVVVGCEPRVCIKGHNEEYIKPAWTSYMKVGEMMIPMHHPAEKRTRYVCDQWEEPKE